MRETRRPAARTPTHEALLRLPVEGLRADVARLPLCVVRAFLDRDRDGFLGEATARGVSEGVLAHDAHNSYHYADAGRLYELEMLLNAFAIASLRGE